MADVALSKRACDRCHSLKERCRWETGRAACERCTRLKHECHLRRPLQKVGRKSRSRRIIVLSDRVDIARSHGSTPSPVEDFSSASTTQSSDDSPEEASTPNSMQLECPPRLLALFGHASPLEQHLLRLSIGAQSTVGRFTIGPSFHRRHQRAMMTQLYSAFPQLKDAFLSCAPILASQYNAYLPEKMEKFCYNKAATAVSSLRSLQVRARQDVPISLSLGVVILTFAICVSGGETLTLARYALGLVKPYYEADFMFDSDETSYLICLIYSETVECLYRGEIPTLRFICRNTDNMVDRYLGISHSLLSLLYDLCEINQALACADGKKIPEILRTLDSVEHSVQGWQPDTPPNFFNQYEPVEVVHILAQAKALRLATLLIIHRLRYPYGTQDRDAESLANAIMVELEPAMRGTDHTVKCTDLCLIVASLEQVGYAERRKACSMIDHLQFSKNFSNTIKRQLQILWAARDHAEGIYWFHLSRYWYG